MYALTELHPKGSSKHTIYINAFVFYLYKLILVPQRNTVVGLLLIPFSTWLAALCATLSI